VAGEDELAGAVAGGTHQGGGDDADSGR
jgi:hypothetical protein